jgi:predicted phosphoribosyltransferase
MAARADVHAPIVLALPRGGVPVAFEVAAALHAPLDVMVVRKLGMPGAPEYAAGAIAGGGIVVMNEDAPFVRGIMRPVIDRERTELARREAAYRRGREPLQLAGHTVLLVDDGMATGATMRVAVQAARAAGASQVIVAVPVASIEACDLVRREGAEVLCLATPAYFRAVGCWYRHFDQTTDDEVHALLAQSAQLAPH